MSPGILTNKNTLEGFQAIDRTQLIRLTAENIWNQINSLQVLKKPSVLNLFHVISYADLKKYNFHYWFAFPALPHAVNEKTRSKQFVSTEYQTKLAKELHKFQQVQPPEQWPFFLIREDKDSEGSLKLSVGPLSEYQTFWSDSMQRKVGFVDPCSVTGVPGWPLRNFLCLLARMGITDVDVLAYRDHFGGSDTINTAPAKRSSSFWMGLEIDALPSEMPVPTGWEKNSIANQPIMVDLSALLDPHKLADQAVNLNLKLMKWRVAPSLDLDSIQSNKCLLLGAGTLGSYIARGLLGWGVTQITLVDSGTVSFSNPVRQPLYTFEDCLDGGVPKAEAAAEMLKKVYPSVQAKGIQMSIPMVGHANSLTGESKQREQYDQLVELIKSHDTIFLLLDSREGRWLPTVIARAFNKLVINVALGFDTFLVMRHGVSKEGEPGSPPNLGCYFCNDVVTPADSVSGQTLDQMCTVTRPGIAMLSSGIAIELFASILQNPLKGAAPAWTEQKAQTQVKEAGQEGNEVLSKLPHQMRGFLHKFDTMKIWGPAYTSCCACSDPIIQAWKQQGWEFLKKVLIDPSLIPEISGLTELQRKTEEATIDWSESE